MIRKLAIVILSASLMFNAGSLSAFARDILEKTVRFPAGSSGTVINDQIVGYDTISYLVNASAGQVMTVRLQPTNNATYFNIYGPGKGPGDEAIANSSLDGPLVPDINQFYAALPASGQYTISVYMMRSAARRDERSRYTLDISIAAGGTATQLPDRIPVSGNPASNSEAQVTGVASNDVLNVRDRPSSQARIVGALSNGTTVLNLGCQAQSQSTWCEIEMLTDMRERGWVNARYLARSSPAQLPAQPPSARTTTGGTRTIEVRFDAGSSGAELRDAIAPGESIRYSLDVREGQNLYARVAGQGLSYQIFNPDGSFLLDQISVKQEYRGELWQSGRHIIEVINRTNSIERFSIIIGVD